MDDEKIIDLYWSRSELAIAATAEKYGRYCRSIARGILSSDADADECLNDTYLAVWNAIPPQKPEKFTAFLGRITRNISLDKYDYNKAKKRNGEFDLLLSELEECIGDNQTGDYAEGEIAGVISTFLKDTDFFSRTVFVRRYWFADSIRTIAEQLGSSEGKIRSSLFRTRKKLKKHLEKEGISL